MWCIVQCSYYTVNTLRLEIWEINVLGAGVLPVI